MEILGDVRSVLGTLNMGSMQFLLPRRKPMDWDGVWVRTGMSESELNEAGARGGSVAAPHVSRRGPFILGNPLSWMVF